MPMSVIVGITGASGSVLALNTVDELLRRDVATTVVCSSSARLVWQDELETPFNDTLVEWQENPKFKFYSANDMRAPIASGTHPARAMVVVPGARGSSFGSTIFAFLVFPFAIIQIQSTD